MEDAPLQKPIAQKHSGEKGPLDGLAWAWNALAILAFTLAAFGVLAVVLSFVNKNPRDLESGGMAAIGGVLAGLIFRTISALLYVASRRIV